MTARILSVLGLALSIAFAMGVGILLMLEIAPDKMRWLVPRASETGGLIFVESPEVYTRQRLVNDRYQQDAWLRSKLDELETAPLISRAESRFLSSDVTSGDESDTAAADASPPPFDLADALSGTDPVPFGQKLALQSALRDRIRQRILENALDDRHDLSGNTVFGLKFDTAVLPGQNTWKAPTVVVQIADTAVDALRDRTDEAAIHYIRASFLDEFDGGSTLAGNADTDQTPDLGGPVARMIGYFARWRGNLERRLNDEKRELQPACIAGARPADLLFDADYCLSGGAPTGLCPDPGEASTFRRWYAATPLCEVVGAGSADGARITANPYVVEKVIPELLAQADQLSEVMQTQLRLPPRAIDPGEMVVEWARAKVVESCRNFDSAVSFAVNDADPPLDLGTDDLDNPFSEDLDGPLPVPPAPGQFDFDPRNAPRSLGGLLTRMAAEDTRTGTMALPGPWGSVFRVDFGALPGQGENCSGSEVDIGLRDLEMNLMVTETGSDTADWSTLSESGLSALPCSAPACTPSAGERRVSVWAERDATSSEVALDAIFTPGMLQTLITSTDPRNWIDEEMSAPEIGEDGACTATEAGLQLQFGRPTAGASWAFFGDRALPEGAADVFADLRCIPGRSMRIRAGAYRFLQRMAATDSYTYAAFPRGDVSGVVTETNVRAGLSLSSPVPGSSFSGELSAGRQARVVEAQPSIINFATGGGAFDFGWSIVKEGRKEPMIASQVVLLSVPAYLDEISLHVWRGFVGVDLGDRPSAQGSGDGTVVSEPMNLAASKRIEAFTRSQEPSTMRLRVPPDYAALDGIIIGNDILSGPRLDRKNLLNRCHRIEPDRDFSIAIEGDRLWRSTVVTIDGVKADRIEVMPDMGGILAVFSADGGRNPIYHAQALRRTLTVWTSEGNDPAPIDICGARPDPPSGTAP